jgi:phospholipid/cholesterol/gamma-HCH transport system permease protein
MASGPTVIPTYTLTFRQLVFLVKTWLADWQRVFMFGAMALVMMVSPATYDAVNRDTIARHVYLTTWRILPWFTVLAALVSWVLIRVVLVTALNYGLAKFALDLVVKVVVLEVIPLFAALYVATRNALSTRTGASGIYIPRDLDVLGGAETDRIRDELVPRVIAYGFSVVTMVVVAGFVTLLMAYLSVYGFSRWGIPEFERTVGQAFDGVATLSFAIKLVFYSLAVAVIPIAASLNAVAMASDATSRLQPGTARLLVTLFVIEGLSLAVRFL